MLATLPPTPAPVVQLAVPGAQVLSPDFAKLQLPRYGFGCGPAIAQPQRRPPSALHGCLRLGRNGTVVVYVETVPLSSVHSAGVPTVVSRA